MSQTVAAAPAPAGGMQRIPLPLESYQHASPPLNHKRLLNLYAEQEPSDSRTAAALIATPGLIWEGVTYGTGPVHAMNTDYPGSIYVASGTHFYRATQPIGSTTVAVEDLGEIGTPSGTDFPFNLMVTIAVGVNGAVVCVPPNAFTCTHTGALNQIGGEFPGARSVTYLDGYFVFSQDEIGGQFFTSLLLDPTAYDALDFAYADGVPNVIRRVMTLRGELWLLGDGGLEIWYDAGSSGLETGLSSGLSFFPFRRQNGGVLQTGCGTIRSAAICDGSLFWVGTNGMVNRSVGYKAQRISTHAIEDIIKASGVTAVTSALSYFEEGHTFYVLNLPDRSLVYDVATGAWAERSSSADGSGPWLPAAVGHTDIVNHFGSSVDGRSYLINPAGLDFIVDTDNDITVMRQFITPPLWAGTYRAFCARLEIEMEVGGLQPTRDIVLDWSDDGGRSWSAGRTMTAGVAYGDRVRVYTTRLGSFRQRMFRVTMTHHATIYGIDVDISKGSA
jgi:hypothetical protein